MKKVMKFLSLFLLSMILFCTTTEASKPIDWKEGGPGRSISPISGYVDGHIITIHLYESPSEATVRIIDERGTIVYENVYDNPQPLVIDVEASATGSYEITVEYDGKAFVGHFVL